MNSIFPGTIILEGQSEALAEGCFLCKFVSLNLINMAFFTPKYPNKGNYQYQSGSNETILVYIEMEIQKKFQSIVVKPRKDLHDFFSN